MALLELRNISMEFPGVKALDGVSLELNEGEIHALVGENGAGKSTLIKILGGLIPAGMYAGAVMIDEQEVRFHSVRDSERAQVRIIHQELSLVNEMTVAENIFLGNEPRRLGVIDYTAMNAQAGRALALLSSDIRPGELVSELTIGAQQIVEIAKALSRKARIIVLDEPTAALPERDVENLLGLVRDLKKRGLGIIYISHRLDEVRSIADTVTVLRNGKRISRFTRGNLDLRSMVRDMIGRSLENAFPPFARAASDQLLTLRAVTLYHPHHRRQKVLSEVSLSCCKGEVVGVAGLLGSGRTALLSLLFGVYRGSHTGELRFEGKTYIPRSPADAIGRGIALVSEDRKRFGLVGAADIKENLSLASLARFCRHRIINLDAVAAACNRYVESLQIKTPSLQSPVMNLSGGNQQKVVLGRFLMTAPRLLLLDDPTRGIDVGAKYEIYRLIHSLSAQGMGIIFISSELPEVLGVAHRIYVLQGGRVREEFKHGEKSEEETLAVAAGISAA
ncbi:MAG: sugar ABC transporter ATP-binding protein [Chitinivibrionales bacterium]|nr:sugar ABC transporter ATP-binding protein [Chitinivibrionales bacterium]